VTEGASRKGGPATKDTRSKRSKRKAAEVAKKLSRWSKVSALGLAMSEKHVAGPDAVNYLKNALGVGRTRAYELIRGDFDPVEQQVKALTPLLGIEAVERLIVRMKDDSDRRAFVQVETALRARGNASLADEVHAFAVAHLPVMESREGRPAS
jgi:hypothetical protein